VPVRSINLLFTLFTYLLFNDNGCCLGTELVTDGADHSDLVCEAVRNQDMFHVVRQRNVDTRVWRRILQDELLDEANEAKV